jgi:serine/threonine protein kinase
MICAHCSTPVADEARFCHSCGSLVSDAEGQAAATASMDQSSFRNMERLLREDTKGEYTVGHMLGRGGMAVVYLATETQLSRKVALKVLPPELTFGHGVERFKREAKTAAALDHPNIIPIYRIGSSGKIFWYAMKFLEGKSLEDLLRERGAMPLDEAIDILEQVADALDYAHEHHVIHRDIKPANVMLDNRNRVIVTDFGIAKALTEGKLTATDSVIGTPYFMSPEQGMGKPVTGASDQYSVAVMAYRMLAGHVPFDGDSAIDILHKHCMFEAPNLHEDVPEIPEHVAAAVARALSKKGDERFATVHDFVQSMKDPNYVPKLIARPSVATVMMDPADAAKVRSGPVSQPVTGRAKSAAPATKPVAAEKTVVAKVSGEARTRAGAAASAPASAASSGSSKMGLYIGIAAVVIGGGGFGVWKMTSGAASSAAPASAEITPPNPSPSAPANDPSAAATSPSAAVDEQAIAKARQDSIDKADEEKRLAAEAAAAKATAKPDTKVAATDGKKSAPPPRTPPETKAADPKPVAPTPTQTAPTTAAPAADAKTKLRIALNTVADDIVIDGESVGQNRRIERDVIGGAHRIVIRKEGFITIDTTVTIDAGKTELFTFTLQPRQP